MVQSRYEAEELWESAHGLGVRASTQVLDTTTFTLQICGYLALFMS